MVSSGRLFHRKKEGVPIALKVSQASDTLPSMYLWQFDSIQDEMNEYFHGGVMHGGNICDSSFDGVCVETDYPLNRGDKMTLSMVNFRQIPFGEKIVDNCEARVIWCRKISSGPKPCYKIGAKRVRDQQLPPMNLKTDKFGSLRCF